MAELIKVNAPVRKPLFEGVQGENEARSIQFDITPWVTELGDGAVTATAKRSQDSQPYPVTVTRDGTTVTWKPTSTDTAYAGVGSFQLEYTVDSVLAKTCIWSTMVAPSLDPAGDPPDPYDNWLAEMREIAADAIQAAQDADENGNATEYGTVSGFIPQWKKFINSGNAVKLYLTLTNGQWTGGEYTDFIVTEGLSGVRTEMKKPDFVSGLTQKNMDAKYACALPATSIRMTVGMPEKFYYKNVLALPSNTVCISRAGGLASWENGGIVYNFTRISTGPTSYQYWVYDENYSIVEEIIPSYAYGVADNLQNASALVIGDSTVAQVTMLQKMADGFTSRGKTLTLLGTRGTAPINHEGRAGWSAKNYCTNDAVSGVTNPFFNPSTEKFDYAYYMGNQGYSNPDFVVVQLGINDLYNVSFKDSDTAIETTAGYVKEIVDSILAYNPTQKILLNLPTAVNEDISRHTGFMPLVRNMFIRYNKYMIILATGYENVRCSYCHLILDPTTDISDDVHPNAGGYEKMANEVISQFNCWQNQ